jgi:hypothetical protein
MEKPKNPVILYNRRCRKFHNKEFHNVHSSPNIIRGTKSMKVTWARHVARMGKTNADRILVAKSEGKRQLGRPTSMREDNIKMDLREVE